MAREIADWDFVKQIPRRLKSARDDKGKALHCV